MSFLAMENKLLEDFKGNNDVWVDYVNNGNKNGHSKTFIIDAGSDLYITYPGYKTSLRKDNTFVYDYRVNFKGYAISHPSIIVDLYNKVKQQPAYAKMLKEFLTVLSKEGDSIDLKKFNDLLLIEYLPPSNDILDVANNTFKRLNKTYLSTGNIAWNFSFKDLAMLISWISLQEDINYPMAIGRYQGRMMPFYRYVESIYSAIAKDQSKYSLDKVIERALVHNQPKLWSTINYAEITQLKSFYK